MIFETFGKYQRDFEHRLQLFGNAHRVAVGPKIPIPEILEHRQDFCVTEKTSSPETH
jgi:hypothetical protein